MQLQKKMDPSMESENTPKSNIPQWEDKVLAQIYKPIPVVITHGSGAQLFDQNETSYIDMTSAYSAVSHGHCHPELVNTLKQQAETLVITSRAFYTDKLAPFAEKLCTLSGLDKAIVMNTGAEAVETAIKCARRWGYQIKKIPKNKAEIIVAKHNFHGRTSGIVGFSSEPEYKKDFGPFTPGFVQVPFADTKAIEQAITSNTCALMIEPMQGEGGINIPPKGWLKSVRKLCDHHNILLILDEIQTGLCRTGAMFAYEHEGIQPDGLILGKALGGGMYPVSAFLSRHEVMDIMGPGSHGSTFGGNPLGCTIGLKAIEILERDNYAQQSREKGEFLKSALADINSPLISDVRGQGLWIGVEFDSEKIMAREVCERLLDHGVLCKETHETVVRFAPPLVISQEQMQYVVDAFRTVVKQLESEIY